MKHTERFQIVEYVDKFGRSKSRTWMSLFDIEFPGNLFDFGIILNDLIIWFKFLSAVKSPFWAKVFVQRCNSHHYCLVNFWHSSFISTKHFDRTRIKENFRNSDRTRTKTISSGPCPFISGSSYLRIEILKNEWFISLNGYLLRNNFKLWNSS